LFTDCCETTLEEESFSLLKTAIREIKKALADNSQAPAGTAARSPSGSPIEVSRK
jgi:hypothetical protein